MQKYKEVNIPAETVQSLIGQLKPFCKNPDDLEKKVREKVHNIAALYLGEINYQKAAEEFRQIKNNPSDLNGFCQRLLISSPKTA